MPIKRAELKADARSLMRTVRPSVYLAALITLIVTWVLSWLTTRVTGLATLQQLLYSAQDASSIDRVMQNYLANPRPFGQFIGILLGFMSEIWSVGFTVFCLRAARGRPVAISNLMDGFAVFLRLLILIVLMSVFVFLWSLLLIFPGIIASFRYSQAIYILLDHPEMSPMDCIRESSRLMKGHKWELFVLRLSFIGWALLALIPLVSIYVSPYVNLTYAGYYNRLIGWVPTSDAMPGTEAEDDRLV